MSNPSAAGAHDGVGDIVLVLALPGLVVGGAAVGAPGRVSLAQGAVEQGELPQLVAAQVVLSLRDLHPLLDHLHDLLDSALHGRGVYGRHVRVKWFVLAREGLPVLPAHFPLLHATLAPDDDPGPSFLLH